MPRRARLDPSLPVLAVLALVLCVLVLLPLGWLALVQRHRQGRARRRWRISRGSPPSARFVGPFLTTIGIALGVSALSCLVAMPLAWLVARTDMPGASPGARSSSRRRS